MRSDEYKESINVFEELSRFMENRALKDRPFRSSYGTEIWAAGQIGDPKDFLIQVFEDASIGIEFVEDVIIPVIKKRFSEEWKNELNEICYFVLRFIQTQTVHRWFNFSEMETVCFRKNSPIYELLYKTTSYPGQSVIDFLVHNVMYSNEITYSEFFEIVIPAIKSYYPEEYSNLTKKVKLVLPENYDGSNEILSFYIEFYELNAKIDKLAESLSQQGKDILKNIKKNIEVLKNSIPNCNRVNSLNTGKSFLVFELLIYLHQGINTNKWVNPFRLFQGGMTEAGLSRLNDFLVLILMAKNVISLRAATEDFIARGRSVAAYLNRSVEYLKKSTQASNYPVKSKAALKELTALGQKNTSRNFNKLAESKELEISDDDDDDDNDDKAYKGLFAISRRKPPRNFDEWHESKELTRKVQQEIFNKWRKGEVNNGLADSDNEDNHSPVALV